MHSDPLIVDLSRNVKVVPTEIPPYPPVPGVEDQVTNIDDILNLST